VQHEKPTLVAHWLACAGSVKKKKMMMMMMTMMMMMMMMTQLYSCVCNNTQAHKRLQLLANRPVAVKIEYASCNQ
jgi:hypothetical protein